jgi:hypothetical protein
MKLSTVELAMCVDADVKFVLTQTINIKRTTCVSGDFASVQNDLLLLKKLHPKSDETPETTSAENASEEIWQTQSTLSKNKKDLRRAQTAS